jgi:hypothetical protein
LIPISVSVGVSMKFSPLPSADLRQFPVRGRKASVQQRPRMPEASVVDQMAEGQALPCRVAFKVCVAVGVRLLASPSTAIWHPFSSYTSGYWVKA